MYSRNLRRASRPHRPARPTLRLERLEDRTVPTQFAWKVDASGNWNEKSNWLLLSASDPSGLGYPHLAGDSALLGFAITIPRTITIPDNVSITVGDLEISSSNRYTIAAAGSGRLHFDNGAGNATLLMPSGTGAQLITAPITLDDTLRVTLQVPGNLNAPALTLSGPIGQSISLPPLPPAPRGLITDGTGTLSLSGSTANTYTGVTNIQSGTLVLAKSAGVNAFAGDLVVGDGVGGGALVAHMQPDNIPDTSAVTVNADGTYVLLNNNETVGSLVIAGGTVGGDAGGLTVGGLTMTGGIITMSGALSLQGDVTVDASTAGSSITALGHVLLGGQGLGLTRGVVFTVADGPAAIDLSILSPVQGSGFLSSNLTKTGAGTMRLGQPGTYTGSTVLNAGTLLIGDNAALGTGTFVINGGTVQADGTARTLANPVTLGGDFTVAGDNALTFNAAATLTGNRTITVSGTGSAVFAGTIGQDSSSRGLTKAGPGNLVLNGTAADTYTGTTTVADGALSLSKTGGAAAVGGNLVIGDGVGTAGTAVALQDQSNTIPDTATVSVNADGLYRLFGVSEVFGPLVVNGGDVAAGGGVLSFTTLSMTGGRVLTSTAGEIRLNGDVTVNASATGSMVAGGFLKLGNATRTFAVADGPAAVDLELNSEIGQTGGAGLVGLVKSGAGTLRIEGSTFNTYSGPTTVSGGTLELDKFVSGGIAVAVPADLTINGGVVRELLGNQIADAAAVNVNAGGTFDIKGQSDIVGALTVTGGTLTTGGTSAGRLTAGNTSFNAAATLAMKLAGATTSDRITVNGTVAVGGALQLNPNSPIAPGTAITLIDNDGTDPVAGTFNGLPEGALLVAGGQTFAISYASGTGNDVVLTRVNPPRVASVRVNDGSSQRSKVTDVTVTFSTTMAFAGIPSAAFRLTRTGPGTPSGDVAVMVDLSGSTASQTVARLIFFGPLTEFGSLIDGNYTLTVIGSQVSASGGVLLDGDADGTPGGDNVSTLFRLFGDVNGDRGVDGLDLTAFRNAFGAVSTDANYNAPFDFDGNGAINGADLTAFRTHFGVILP
jgi:autotransporter-associated beta strand protein